MAEKYYKVLDGDGLSPSVKFDYKPYLPKKNSAGKWLPKIDKAKMLKDGYYVSKYWNMWYSAGASVFEVECRGILKPENIGVEKQICCQEIRLVKDVTKKLLKSLRDKNFNIADGNVGRGNLGGNNVGNYNGGAHNTGDLNLGNFNTGDCNVGIDNVGDNNLGSANAGSRNIGHSNTGDNNMGSYNSGSGNRGNGNAGSFNLGNNNVGKWNIGNAQRGFFNTEEECARMFNKPTALRQKDIMLPKFLQTKNTKEAFSKASDDEIFATLKLPNFDFKIFEKITGISKKNFEKKLGKKL